MEGNDFIKVLWVEDDPEVTVAYPLQAENYDLQLVSFPCWDDAKVALEGDYDRWSAIILDANCVHHKGEGENVVKFLGHALNDISRLRAEKGRLIPWYILSGGAEKDISDSIIEERMEWDSEWTEQQHKKYYSKNVDNEVLYERIKAHAQKSVRIQIREMYNETNELLIRLNNDVCEDILTILETMHFPKSHPHFVPRLFYNPLRKALEYVFRALGEAGVIPDVFFSKGVVNLNQCFMFLIGRDAEKVGYRYGNAGDRVVPRHIQDMMSLIINLGNSNSHSTNQSHFTELSEAEIQRYENQMKSSGVNSRFLVFSMALQFCEIVQWMNIYIKEHPDKAANLAKCVKNEIFDDDAGNKSNEIVGIIEQDDDGLYHIGKDYSVYLRRKELIGKKVRATKSTPNTSPKSKDKYPYFVHDNDIQVVDVSENGSK